MHTFAILLIVTVIPRKYVNGRYNGRQGCELMLNVRSPAVQEHAVVKPLKHSYLSGLATIPTKVVSSGGTSHLPRPYAMVPAEDQERSTLSSILDSREHWWISRYLQQLQRIPPVTGLYLMSSTITALLAWMVNDNYPFDIMQFDMNLIKKGEAWRLVTPFLLFGPLWLSHIFMAQSVALYMSSVEISYCAKPEKFVELLLFGMASISAYGVAESLTGRGDMTMMSAAYHLHTYMLYYWSRINEGSVVNCFDLFNLPAEAVPMLFMLQNYLLYREFYVADIAALGAAYFYFYFLSDTAAVWPMRLLQNGFFKGLYQRYNNEISR
ncbi:hypothetical protein BgAZ_100230 [Babesia gibsoni]|uniref:Derlin n=1 Tax=Babesia gibsoni TaxID=33632 RepID=A0AAD8UTA9_BABGI|nr:hypothetical protein BgAZ_100230 [Babesia gibsoni]